MLVTVHDRLECLSGSRADMTSYECVRSDLNMAPRIGSHTVRKLIGCSGTARDTILGVEPYATLTTPKGEVFYAH